MTSSDAPVGEATVTQRLLDLAQTRGDRRALAGGADGESFTYAELAATVQSAAAGLAWRGVQPRDIVGVYVPDAVSYVLATHAIRAAGGIPTPVAPGLSVQEIAGQLAQCGARMLLTAPPLAAAALPAADRSWVRQVISFGEAAGAIPFSSLLRLGSLRPASARAHDVALLPFTRRLDGSLGPAALTHIDFAADLARLAAEAGITERDVVLAAPPAGGGGPYTTFIDNALVRGATVVAARPEEMAAAADAHHGTAVILPPGADVCAAEPLRVFAVAS
ncbi:MAG: AMP-binding protein [Streptosporangiaceae bacterium]|jgi:acyl-CoA synthetase (AMP-forming)/AMP-acid ligase II